MTTSKLSRIAAPVIAAFASAEKAQVKIGDAVLAAASKLSEADIKPFCEAIKASLEARGFTPNSAKVTTMHVRRVITAVVVDGLQIEPGQSLRGLYESLPKGDTGGASHGKRGAKLPNPMGGTSLSADEDEPGESDAPQAATPTSEEQKADAIRRAITVLFGHCDADLIDAMAYATAHELLFTRWAQSSARAAQMAELEKAVTPAPRRKAKAKAEEAVAA